MEVKGKKQDVILSDKDELWAKFKHLHIADVLEGLKAFLDEIKAKNPAVSQLGNKGGEAPSMKELGVLVKALPEYEAQLARYSQHHQLAQRCLRIIQARDNTLLNMINDVEQTLATGSDQEGAPLQLPTTIDAIIDFLMTDDVMLKLRLVLVLVASMVNLPMVHTSPRPSAPP